VQRGNFLLQLVQGYYTSRGTRVRSIVTLDSNSYDSIQHFLAGECPNDHAHGSPPQWSPLLTHFFH